MKALLSNKVENIVTNEELAHCEQFLLLSQCFKKSSAADESKFVRKWERVKTKINAMVTRSQRRN